MQKAHTEIQEQVDWSGIASDFHNSTKSLRAIARDFGVSDAAVRKHAKRCGWHRPSAVGAVDRDTSTLANALAAQLASVDSVIERSRRFVAAMVQLGAEPSAIAGALNVSERALFAEFGGEIEFHAGRSRNAAG